jgi:hypothetical protein
VLEDMSALPALDWLDLSDNELSGPLPAFPLAVRCGVLSCVSTVVRVHCLLLPMFVLGSEEHKDTRIHMNCLHK